MATRTINDLCQAVMEDLGLIDANDTPASTDRAFIERRYREGLEELREDSLVWWDTAAIPYAVFLPVVGYVSILVSEAFGLPRQIPMDTELEAAKLRIRRRVAKRSAGEQTEFNDY